jgi:hypothetical protein
MINSADYAPIIGAISGLAATVFAFVNVMMTRKQNIVATKREAKQDEHATQTLKAISEVTGTTGTNKVLREP